MKAFEATSCSIPSGIHLFEDPELFFEDEDLWIMSQNRSVLNSWRTIHNYAVDEKPATSALYRYHQAVNHKDPEWEEIYELLVNPHLYT